MPSPPQNMKSSGGTSPPPVPAIEAIIRGPPSSSTTSAVHSAPSADDASAMRPTVSAAPRTILDIIESPPLHDRTRIRDLDALEQMARLHRRKPAIELGAVAKARLSCV